MRPRPARYDHDIETADWTAVTIPVTATANLPGLTRRWGLWDGTARAAARVLVTESLRRCGPASHRERLTVTDGPTTLDDGVLTMRLSVRAVVHCGQWMAMYDLNGPGDAPRYAADLLAREFPGCVAGDLGDLLVIRDVGAATFARCESPEPVNTGWVETRP